MQMRFMAIWSISNNLLFVKYWICNAMSQMGCISDKNLSIRTKLQLYSIGEWIKARLKINWKLIATQLKGKEWWVMKNYESITFCSIHYAESKYIFFFTQNSREVAKKIQWIFQKTFFFVKIFFLPKNFFKQKKIFCKIFFFLAKKFVFTKKIK